MDSTGERIKLIVVKAILILSIIATGQLKSCSAQELTTKVVKGDFSFEGKQGKKIFMSSASLFERRK
jgi:hypothetical protein